MVSKCSYCHLFRTVPYGSQTNLGAIDIAENKQRQDVSATEAFVSC